MTCPLCGARGELPELGRWKEYVWRDCPFCGAAFCEPFKSPGPEYYSHQEDMYPHAAETGTDPMSREYDRALARLGRMPRPLRLLDVGCGGGGFLRRARALGIDAVGLDFNKARVEAVNAALGAGAAECAGLEDYARGKTGTFDAVTMFQVLEHLDRPGPWIDAARSLLKSGGILIMGTPNRERTFEHAKGPRAALDNPPHHLSRWSKRALTAFLIKHGFEITEIGDLPMPIPLISLLLRERLSFGLTARWSPPGSAGGAPGVRQAVNTKTTLLNGMSVILYPLYRLISILLRWQGIVLFCVARKK